MEARVANSGDVMIFPTMGEMGSRERGLLALSLLLPSFLSLLAGIPAHGMVSPSSRQVVSLQLNLSGKAFTDVTRGVPPGSF